ncbi:MAG: hypothetical protein ACRDIL_03375, partial [Candidatus Limnocylindrales bacterium]
QADRLHARVAELFDQHWPTRVCRGMWPSPDDGVDLPPGAAWSTTSLPFMLHEGRWTIGLELDDGNVDNLEGLRIEIRSPDDQVEHLLVISEAKVGGTAATWEFDQERLKLALSIRIVVDRVAAPARLRMPLSIRLAGP